MKNLRVFKQDMVESPSNLDCKIGNLDCNTFIIKLCEFPTVVVGGAYMLSD